MNATERSFDVYRFVLECRIGGTRWTEIARCLNVKPQTAAQYSIYAALWAKKNDTALFERYRLIGDKTLRLVQ